MAMQIVIRETGEERELSITDAESGQDWVSDLIGNAGMLGDECNGFVRETDEDGDDTDRWICDLDTYEWWEKYINNYQATEEDIESLAEEMEEADVEVQEDPQRGIYSALDYVKDRVEEAMTGVDMEDERNAAIGAMDAIREEFLQEA